MDYEARVDSYLTKRWYINDVLNRLHGPAVEYENGDKEWWRYGFRHRVEGPAVERTSGYKEWWYIGLLHREDGPAIEFSNGDRYWYLNGRKFKTKEAWFKALNKEAKMKAIFSEHFIKG